MKPIKGDVLVSARYGLTFLNVLKRDPSPSGYAETVKIGVSASTGELYSVETGHININELHSDEKVKYEWLYRSRPEIVAEHTESANVPAAPLDAVEA